MRNAQNGPTAHRWQPNLRHRIGALVAVLAIGALLVAAPPGLVGAASSKAPARLHGGRGKQTAASGGARSQRLTPMSGSSENVAPDDAGITISNYTGTGIDLPTGITAGSDGALWFTNFGNGSIGRITTAGVVSQHTGSSIDDPEGITAGPDGALWFADPGNSEIGRITTAGVVSDFVEPASAPVPINITSGPDGALWFTNTGNNTIGRISTSGVITSYTGVGINGPDGITTGPDGALWFTNSGNNSIGRITTAGVVSNYTGTGIAYPHQIVAGPDGALWFVNADSASIGRITTAGVVSNYTGTGIEDPTGITVGSDGALWFTNYGTDSIGRITTAGVVSNYSGSGISGPQDITLGPDGALWFANYGNNSIGRIGGTAPTISGTPPSPVGVNGSYDFSFTLTGGPTPTTTVTSGSLPPGLSLSTGGVISGSPTTVGSYTATVTAANAVTPNATDTFTIVVGVPPTISGTPSSDVSPGTAYSYSFSLAATPAPTTTVTSGSLPPGLSLSTGGTIAGTPTTAGTYMATVTATNGIPPDASDTFTIVVLGAPTISGAPPSPINAGNPYYFAFTLSGSPSPATSVTSGSLPPGLGLSSNGVITGTPITAGSYSATVTATNGVAPDATENIDITVDPTLMVSPDIGLAGTSVNVSGAGFEPGETVDVTYDAPASTDLCSALTVASDGTFTCTGDIPSAPGAGKNGLHTISATGMTSGINATASFTLITKSPTLTVKPSAGLIGNKSVHISGRNWPAGDGIHIDQCAENPTTDPGSCIYADDEVASNSGTWSVHYVPVVGEVDNACATECYIEATDGTTDVVKTLTFKTPSVEIRGGVSDGIYIGQRVSVVVRNFPARDPVTIEICSFNDCDSDTEASKTLSSAGDATFGDYTMDPFVCSPDAEDCYLLAQDSVSNGPVVATEGFAPYCGPIICPPDATKR